MAAVNIWVAGSDEQQAEVARRLLAGERIAVGFHELDHGNDLLSNECRATAADGTWRVSGVKQVINNIDRAESVLIMARTRDDGVAARHLAAAVAQVARDRRPRRHLADACSPPGMRGCAIGAADSTASRCRHPASSARTATPSQTALKAFQVTRAIIPALAVGARRGRTARVASATPAGARSTAAPCSTSRSALAVRRCARRHAHRRRAERDRRARTAPRPARVASC